MIFDFLVIGAGAAGLMASASAARRDKSVLLLEKNKKLGVKVLMSGGTRCNITHHCDIRGIVTAFGRNGKFLHSALAALPPDAVVEEIENCGVKTKVESTGKVFPVSNRAIDVRDALVKLAESAGAEIRNSQAVVSITKNNDRFEIQTTSETYLAHKVLITTGGKSYPGCGTTGDGYQWAKQFGHTIVNPVPALTPILSNESWANNLKGVTLDDVRIKVVDTSNKPSKKEQALADERGSFLFAHFGFSGPAALNASRAITQHPDRKKLQLVCDWLPSISAESLREQFRGATKNGGKQVVSNLLGRWLTKRLADSLIELTGVDPNTRNAELSKKQIEAIAKQLKRTIFSIPGTLGFEKAEVTAGGVSLSEVKSQTMESRLMPGLFFAGEILDLDGPIGGFNFQSAFSTGFLAGLNA